MSHSLLYVSFSSQELVDTNTPLSEKIDEKTPIPPPDWEVLIAEIADDIIAEHTPSQILKVRTKLYDLLTHCIPASTILKTLTFQLVKKVEPSLRPDVVQWSAFYEHRTKLGSVSVCFSS